MNKTLYTLDANNKELLNYLGVSSSGTSDLRSSEFTNRFSMLMKEDRAECEQSGRSDILL